MCPVLIKTLDTCNLNFLSMLDYRVDTHLFLHASEYNCFLNCIEYFLPHITLKWPCKGFAMDNDMRFTLKKGNWIYLGAFM